LKSQQRVGTGVYIPATKTAIYVNSGGVGISNTINRAELTGIASALEAKCIHIGMDSAVLYLRYGNNSYFLNYTGSTHIAKFWDQSSP